jgi:hypothetical protein
MSRIYPLKGKNRTGDTKWYQELQFQYSASIDNQISTKDSLLFTSQVFKNMRSGFKHDAPLSIQIRPFKKIPGFTISPQLSYSGVLYTKKYNERWDPDYFNPVLNKTVPSAVRDTLTGFFYGQSVTASVSTGISPQIFGTYEIKNPNSRLRVIRHVMKPSVGFSYVPVIKGLTSDMYREVQIDTAGRMKRYSIFDGNIYGTPSLGSRSGNITFSLINIVEAKVFAKNDTTGKPNKVKIIDNFTTNTSYNIFADSLRWAPITMNYRATLFKNVGFAASSSFSLYGTDQKGRTVNTFYLDQKGRLMRMTGLSLSLDFDLSQFFKSKDAKKKDGNETQNKLPLEQLSNNRNNYGEEEVTPPSQQATTTYDRFGYPDFSMPWSLRAAYSFYYQKPGSTSQITQSLQLSGDVTLTKKTSIRYSTGYDIARKQITMSSISITRDLHCWDMGFEWIPTGYMKSWFFTLRVKASVLQDLKYERRKDFHDQY